MGETSEPKITDLVKLHQEVESLREELFEKEQSLVLQENHTMSTHKYNRHLTGAEISRYSRQIILWNQLQQQINIKTKSVLLVGCGSMGGVCAMYLTAAGVGNITIVDNALVSPTKLHGQVIHKETDIGAEVTNSAFEKLRRYSISGHLAGSASK